MVQANVATDTTSEPSDTGSRYRSGGCAGPRRASAASTSTARASPWSTASRVAAARAIGATGSLPSLSSSVRVALVGVEVFDHRVGKRRPGDRAPGPVKDVAAQQPGQASQMFGPRAGGRVRELLEQRHAPDHPG